MARGGWPLPPEITDSIISLTQTDGIDRSTLCSCSIVSREWHSWTLPRLFRTVTLTDYFDIDYMASRFPYVTPLVHDLHFLYLKPMTYREPDWIICTLSSQPLPRLRKLKFSTNFYPSPLNTFQVQSNTFIANSLLVQAIEFLSAPYWSFEAFCHIVSLFPNCRRLSFNTINNYEEEYVLDDSISSPRYTPPVSFLKITPYNGIGMIGRIIEWILLSPSVVHERSIQELKLLLDPSLICHPIFVRLMTTVGPSLQYLRIRFPDKYRQVSRLKNTGCESYS